MLFQIEVPTETLSANLAREGLLLVVRVHMKGQVVDLVKGLVAHVTLILLLAAVCQFVILVVAPLMESLTAEFTDERFITLVNAHVCVESRASVERLAACITLVRFLRCVDDLVAAQGTSLSKALPAHLAYEWSGPRMHRHVSG